MIAIILFLFSFGYAQTIPTKENKIEMKDIALRLQTPMSVHKYLWDNTNYTKLFYMKNINDYWNDRIGDCSEVMNVEYVMLKSLDYKVRKCKGFLNGISHHSIQYWNGTDWFKFDNTSGDFCV